MQPRRAPIARATEHVKTVSQLNAEARFLVEERFRRVWVQGEISNFRRYPSGHWYFSLKDDRAQLRCVLFASRNRFVRFMPQDGLEVLVRGTLTLYEARGEFQAIVEHIEPAGEGALRAAFEQLKARLAAQGLFAEERKRPLPAFPRHIAVISSREGAALRDVLAVLQRRFPCLRVTCFYVAVQGFEAVPQIAGAFDRAERMRHAPDVIIVTRGGGSLEDLAAFNHETVARRIAAARIPVVAAIGHETDVTIADFVADQRAPTPSAAAEMVTPDRLELSARLTALEAAITSKLGARMHLQRSLLAATRRRLVHPGRTLQQRLLRTDELAERLRTALNANVQRAQTALRHQGELLRRASPQPRVDRFGQSVEHLQDRLAAATANHTKRTEAKLATLTRALSAVSPLATLARGYAIVAKPDGSRWGKPITAAAQAQSGDAIVAHLADGTLRARVQEVEDD